MCNPDKDWRRVLGFAVIALMITAPLLWWDRMQRLKEQRGSDGPRTHTVTHEESRHHTQNTSHLNCTKRDSTTAQTRDKWVVLYGGIELDYVSGSITTFKFDLCNIINCHGNGQSWRGYDVYLCMSQIPTGSPLCQSWGQVWWNTKPQGWANSPSNSNSLKHWQPKVTFWRSRESTGHNPLQLTIDKLDCQGSKYLVVGVDQTGADTMGLIKLNFLTRTNATQITTSTSQDGDITRGDLDLSPAGLENLPLISAFFPLTTDKNFDQINYIHYNVQRLANATRDAVAGLSEQLASTSLMAVQNRKALDVLLAEKGGVCQMLGEQCTTLIANNAVPDGSVTRALKGPRALSTEMAENLSIEYQFSSVLDNWFRKWEGVLVSAFITLVAIICALALCGCTPCSLCKRVITTAVEKKDPLLPPPPYPLRALQQEQESLPEWKEYGSDGEDGTQLQVVVWE